MYKNLKFFNKNGDLTNFQYDNLLDKWVGSIDLGLISVDLIASYQIFVMEEVMQTAGMFTIPEGYAEEEYSKNSQFDLRRLTYPINLPGDDDFKIKFENRVDEIFIYGFEQSEGLDVITKSYESDLGLIEQGFEYEDVENDDYTKIVDQITNSAILINLALWPTTEDSFSNKLLIYDPNNSDHILAEINLYGESEGEDERLTDMLTNIGLDILPSDVKIFKESDVNEEFVDWILINRKKRELLLEHSNIFPYMGSYKALINILKYFGYSNVRLKEYWQNVDINTPNYGKFKQVDIAQIFTNKADYIPKELINSKIWNKTNKFGLFYDITIEDPDAIDDRGTPLAKEVYTFTPDEILIKIFALKKKLQLKFLPINAKIVDIVGECVLFGTYNIGHITSSNVINSFSEEINLDLICPKTSGYIEDLRYLGRTGENDITVYPDLELTKVEISKVEEQNWERSTSFPTDLPINIGFPLILDIKNTETYNLFSDYNLLELTYQIFNNSGTFNYSKTIDLINNNDLEIGVILPYKGKYTIKITYKNSVNFEYTIIKNDFIDVKMYNADFIGVYSQLDGKNNWDTKKRGVQEVRANKYPMQLNWDDYDSIWNIPQHPNESIEMLDISYDNLNLIQFRQNEPITSNEWAIQNRLKWSKLKSINWEDSQHLYWDNIGTCIIQFDLFDIINLDYENNILIINGVIGPTLSSLNGFTQGAIGSIAISNSISVCLDAVKELNSTEGPFNDFVFYYEPYYELDDNSNSIVNHSIKAFSKKVSSNKNYELTNINNSNFFMFPGYVAPGYLLTNALGAAKLEIKYPRESIDLGFIGDAPASFEIYRKNYSTGATVLLTINKIQDNYSPFISDNFVSEGYTEETGQIILDSAGIELSGTIEDYLDQLNSSTDPLISSFNYGIHKIIDNYTSTSTDIPYKIIATTKNIGSLIYYELFLSNSNEVIITDIARSIVKNPTYQNLRVAKYSKELPKFSNLYFTTDNCKIRGIQNINWKISNTTRLNYEDIYLNSNLISFLFTVGGSYDILIQIEDKNGNKNELIKNEIIKIN